MAKDLAYDMMLEVFGLIRSFGVRTTLDRDLRELRSAAPSLEVFKLDAVERDDLDRRLVAHEVEDAA